MNPSPSLVPIGIGAPDVVPALSQIYNYVAALVPPTLNFLKSFMFFLVGLSIPISVFLFIVII